MRVADLMPRDGRPLAVMLLAIVLLVVYMFGVHWWFVSPHIGFFKEMAELREQQQRFAQIAGERATIEQRLAEVRSYEQGNQAFLADFDVNAASAGLIQRIKQAQTDNTDPKRCSLVSTQSYSGGEEELYKRITVQVRLRCDLESLVDILYDLENGKPYLFVDQMMIYKQQTYVPPGGKAVVSPLDVRFNVSGYLRQPGKPAS